MGAPNGIRMEKLWRLSSSFAAIFVALCSLNAHGVEAKYKISLEMNPVFTGLSAIEDVEAWSVSGEFAMGEQLVVTASQSQAAMELASSDAAMSSEASLSHADLKLTGFGLRLYSNRQDDSFYFGIHGTQAVMHARVWSWGESQALQAAYFAPGSDAGYRWVWESGFMTRVGLIFQSITNPQVSFANTMVASDLSTREVDRLLQEHPGWSTGKAPLVPALDVTIGWVL